MFLRHLALVILISTVLGVRYRKYSKSKVRIPKAKAKEGIRGHGTSVKYSALRSSLCQKIAPNEGFKELHCDGVLESWRHFCLLVSCELCNLFTLPIGHWSVFCLYIQLSYLLLLINRVFVNQVSNYIIIIFIARSRPHVLTSSSSVHRSRQLEWMQKIDI